MRHLPRNPVEFRSSSFSSNIPSCQDVFRKFIKLKLFEKTLTNKLHISRCLCCYVAMVQTLELSTFLIFVSICFSAFWNLKSFNQTLVQVPLRKFWKRKMSNNKRVSFVLFFFFFVENQMNFARNQ